VELARRRALDVRTRRRQAVRQAIVMAMRSTKNAGTIRYYRRVLARLDAAR
jgi:hypothetical protein